MSCFLTQNVIDMIIEKNCKSIKDILNNDIQVNGIIYSPIFGDLEYLGECLCAKCYKECEDPIEQMDSLKDKVRDKWGKNDMKNAMHSSDSIENVKRESKIVFK